LGEETYLIVGLGNPGVSYEKTRHNVGFRVVQELAKKHGLGFKRKAFCKSYLAEGEVEGRKVLLQVPQTYMNLSGEAVKASLDFWKVSFSNLLIICDDVAIDLGRLRLRAGGRSGGHNGLKSIEHHLQTIFYPRLRVGVGNPSEGDLADYVLGSFSEEEMKIVLSMVERSIETVEMWLRVGITSAMNFANGDL